MNEDHVFLPILQALKLKHRMDNFIKLRPVKRYGTHIVLNINVITWKPT